MDHFDEDMTQATPFHTWCVFGYAVEKIEFGRIEFDRIEFG
jgi:hypothetical protein